MSLHTACPGWTHHCSDGLMSYFPILTVYLASSLILCYCILLAPMRCVADMTESCISNKPLYHAAGCAWYVIVYCLPKLDKLPLWQRLRPAISPCTKLLAMLGTVLILLCETLGEDYGLDVLLLHQFTNHPGINLLKDSWTLFTWPVSCGDAYRVLIN